MGDMTTRHAFSSLFIHLYLVLVETVIVLNSRTGKCNNIRRFLKKETHFAIQQGSEQGSAFPLQLFLLWERGIWAKPNHVHGWLLNQSCLH